MVPHTVNTPLPREKFSEYGTERMMYVLELRHSGIVENDVSLIGFKFSILRQAFVFDIPHVFSIDVVTNDNAKTVTKEKTKEFKIFVNHLKRFVPDSSVVTTCLLVSLQTYEDEITSCKKRASHQYKHRKSWLRNRQILPSPYHQQPPKGHIDDP